jgi:sugar phosphate permease
MWSMPAALFLVAFFHRNAPGVMARDLMETFGVGGTVIGLVSATYFYSYAGFMVPGGMLLEAFGTRRVVSAGGIVMALGTLAMSAAGGTALLFAGRFAVGLGAAVTFIGTLKIAAAWFPPERFGLLSAVSATVGVVGGLVAAAPLAFLMSLAGWRGALFTVAAVTLACSLVCLAVLRDQPGPAAAAAHRPWGDVLRGMRRVLANPHTWPVFLSFFCLYSAMGNLFLWAVPFLRDVYGLTTTKAAAIAGAPSIALLGSAPLTGFVSDTVLHRRKAPYVALSATLLAVWALFLGTLGAVPLWAVGVLFFAVGLFGGAFVLTWPMGREVNAPELAGLAVAVVNLGGWPSRRARSGPCSTRAGPVPSPPAVRAPIRSRRTAPPSGSARRSCSAPPS